MANDEQHRGDGNPRMAGPGVLGFALLFPSILTWVYFVALSDQSTGTSQTAYGIGKVIQFGLPLFWVIFVLRRKVRVSRPERTGLWLGAGIGLLIAATMVSLYAVWLGPTGFFEGPAAEVKRKVIGMGIDTAPKYIALAIAYAAFHSLMEEYYWRWFVFGELRHRMSLATAIAISSLGFMAHHVIVLATYFGWTSPTSYLFSLGVAVGGAVWAWLYHRTDSLYGAWLSHCLVDAAIFAIGYDMVRSGLA